MVLLVVALAFLDQLFDPLVKVKLLLLGVVLGVREPLLEASRLGLLDDEVVRELLDPVVETLVLGLDGVELLAADVEVGVERFESLCVSVLAFVIGKLGGENGNLAHILRVLGKVASLVDKGRRVCQSLEEGTRERHRREDPRERLLSLWEPDLELGLLRGRLGRVEVAGGSDVSNK